MTLPAECRPLELAEALGVKEPSILRYLGTGIPQVERNGKRLLPVTEALKWLAAKKNQSRVKSAARRLLDEGFETVETTPEPESDETMTEARTRKEIASANLEELKVAERMGDLVDRALFEKALDDLATGWRKGILQRAPPRIAPLLVGKDVREITSILKDELRKELER